MRRTLVRLAVWILALAGLAAMLALAWVAREWVREHREAEEAGEEPPPRRAANRMVKLGARLAESHGLADEPAQAVAWAARVAVYGRVVANPKATAEVRAPLAGTLRADAERGWPGLGTRAAAGQVLGWLDVRVPPAERLDLLTKLNEARLKEEGAEEQLLLAEQRLARFKAAGEAVSRSELDTTAVQVTEARTLRETARAGVREWQRALAAIDRGGQGWSQPLAAPAAGEVIELAGRPGMAVEAGGLVARLIDFGQVLVRLELPPEVLALGVPAEVELLPLAPVAPALAGAPNRPEPPAPARTRRARLVGPAPQVETGSQNAAYWYEVIADLPGGAPGWRPGLAVKGQAPAAGGPPRPAVAVPETALLYHEGRALVYVRVGAGRYERREVPVLGRDGGRWVLGGGVEAGEPVVSRRAQVLLSEEFRGEADLD